MKFKIEVAEVGDLGLTGLTPRREEIDHHDLVVKLAGCDRPAGEIDLVDELGARQRSCWCCIRRSEGNVHKRQDYQAYRNRNPPGLERARHSAVDPLICFGVQRTRQLRTDERNEHKRHAHQEQGADRKGECLRLAQLILA